MEEGATDDDEQKHSKQYGTNFAFLLFFLQSTKKYWCSQCLVDALVVVLFILKSHLLVVWHFLWNFILKLWNITCYIRLLNAFLYWLYFKYSFARFALFISFTLHCFNLILIFWFQNLFVKQCRALLLLKMSFYHVFLKISFDLQCFSNMLFSVHN